MKRSPQSRGDPMILPASLSEKYKKAVVKYRELSAIYSDLLGATSDNSNHGKLKIKYLRLVAKYRSLEARYTADLGAMKERLIVADWALRNSRAGFAFIRRGEIVETTPRFDQIQAYCKRGRVWHAWPLGESDSHYKTLGEIVVERVRSSRKGPAEYAPLVCFQVEGDERVVEVSVERLGRRGLWVATVTDVTERVRQEFELAEARRHLAQEERLRTIGAVSSGIAHDLNNALNAIGISLYQLAETTDERKRADKIQRLSRSVNDAADRIHRLQDIVKQRTGYESALFDLAEVIEEAAELARAEFTQASPFRRHAHHVRTTLKASTLIRADRSEMKHVFLNLILNARDAMPDGGNVSVTTRDEDGNTVVEVADEGTGISEEQLAKIFEPFFTTKGIEGTGLGLSMARSAMNRIGGRISAANRPSGGAVFTLVFPPHCATDDHSPSHEFSPAIAGRDNNSGEQNALSGSAPESSCSSKLRVLIVDDDPDCLSGMREMLQRRGCEVDIASSGNAAIRKVKAGKTYDLVLCDIWMPDLNGWDVAKRITECTPEARICMFTGQSALRPANSTQGNIIADVLTKPVLPEQLDRFLSRN